MHPPPLYGETTGESSREVAVRGRVEKPEKGVHYWAVI
jgi:hypothetical protein